VMRDVMRRGVVWYLILGVCLKGMTPSRLPDITRSDAGRPADATT
jgi:hypothetical protein